MYQTDFTLWVAGAWELYLEAKAFLEESKNDPPEEPYRGKYKAREVLTALETDIRSKWPITDNLCIINVLALVKFELGAIALETEELSDANDHLTDAWLMVKAHCEKPDCCILSISILNQLSILLSKRSELVSARDYLLKADMIYTSMKEDEAKRPPHGFQEFFLQEYQEEENSWNVLENLFTYTMYYLAQVYELMNENELSAKYCSITLKRQKERDTFDLFEWAVNCAFLSQYFVQNHKFRIARHLLASSSVAILKYRRKCDEEMDNSDEEGQERLYKGEADIARCCIKYCINLFTASLQYKDSSERNDDWNEANRMLTDEETADFDDKVPCNFIHNYSNARQLFQSGYSGGRPSGLLIDELPQ